MAAIDSAIAVDQSDLVYGEQATVIANATSQATASAASTAGAAAATADITANTGLDQSSLVAGTSASLDVDVNGTATSSAATIDGATSVATSTFSGDIAGITDATLTDVDLTIGTAGVVDVDLNALSQATASNVDGSATATSDTGAGPFGAFGISGTGISAGTTATITADVDADSLTVATTVGDADAATVAAGSDASANSDLTAVGINNFGATTGNITVGTDATIRGAAGSSADRVTVGATATTQTGAATADADAASVVGILDLQDGAATATAALNSITVGQAGTVTGLAYTNFDAVAASTTGAATADSTATNISGIQSDTVVIGTDARVQGQANTQMDASATVVDGIEADTGIALATANVIETKGVDLEVLSVGNSAAGTTGYNILGRTDADLDVSAASTGANSVLDSATASGTVNDAAGLELGNVGALVGAGLSVGTNASLAGVANLEMDASAASVDGNVSATSFVGDGVATDLENGAVGIELGDVATIGTNATVLGQGTVDLSATATNIGNQGTGNEPTVNASAAADFVAGLNIADITSDVSFGTNASVTAAGTATADATATSVTGDAVNAFAGNGLSAAGIVENMDVVGLNSDADITFGTSSNVNADAKVDLTATAGNTGTLGALSNVSADAELRSAVGLDMYESATASGAFTVGTTAVVDADSVITGKATATSVEGTVNADAAATTNIGAQTGAFTVGQSAVVTADADSTQVATAATIGNNGATAVATADATVATNIGLDAQGAFSVGTNASVTGIADATNKATATNVDQNATATAGDVAAQISGVDTGSSFTVGTNGNLTGQAIVDQDAIASTGGLTAGGQSATAMAQAVEVSGLELDGGAAAPNWGTTFGTNATVIGSAAVTNDATATGVYASADADVDVSTIQGVELNGAGLTTGTEATMAARATAANVATAQSTSGNADADIDVDLIGGLNATDESVTIGTAGIIDADASVTNVATASSVDASGAAVDATVNNDRVVGIELASASATTGVLSTGTTLALDADAVSSQIASASNIGDPLGTDQAATATVASGDLVYGIQDTIITVGTNTTQLTSSATLVGDATASNMSGTSTAQAGGTAGEVIALDNSNTIIGLNATNGMSLQASSTLSADASSIEDAATAKAGTANALIAGAFTTQGRLTAVDDVTGVDSSDITVGNDSGTILAAATGRLEAIASTKATTTTAQAATAMAAQDAAGLVNSTVTIGNDGNLTGTANLVGTASASNVGDIASINNANSVIQLNGQGINQTAAAGDQITIGADGNVAGRAFVDGSAISTSVNGSAEAQGDLISLGLQLDDLSDITIGQSGNISGLSVLGEMSATGSFTDQVDVLASTTSEDASAYGIFDSAGILGQDATTAALAGDQTVLTAGPTDGDITGQGLAGVNAVASTIGTAAGDNAIASLAGSVSGIQDVDILGGMQGINMVKGTSFGDFDASASSIKGDATSTSNTDAYGIFDANGDGAITLSGNIVAQAVLSNTVMASSVNGSATATATGDAIGMGGYDITIIGSGSFTASANSSSAADARSVLGTATA